MGDSKKTSSTGFEMDLEECADELDLIARKIELYSRGHLSYAKELISDFGKIQRNYGGPRNLMRYFNLYEIRSIEFAIQIIEKEPYENEEADAEEADALVNDLKFIADKIKKWDRLGMSFPLSALEEWELTVKVNEHFIASFKKAASILRDRADRLGG